MDDLENRRITRSRLSVQQLSPERNHVTRRGTSPKIATRESTPVKSMTPRKSTRSSVPSKIATPRATRVSSRLNDVTPPSTPSRSATSRPTRLSSRLNDKSPPKPSTPRRGSTSKTATPSKVLSSKANAVTPSKSVATVPTRVRLTTENEEAESSIAKLAVTPSKSVTTVPTRVRLTTENEEAESSIAKLEEGNSGKNVPRDDMDPNISSSYNKSSDNTASSPQIQSPKTPPLNNEKLNLSSVSEKAEEMSPQSKRTSFKKDANTSALSDGSSQSDVSMENIQPLPGNEKMMEREPRIVLFNSRNVLKESNINIPFTSEKRRSITAIPGETLNSAAVNEENVAEDNTSVSSATNDPDISLIVSEPEENERKDIKSPIISQSVEVSSSSERSSMSSHLSSEENGVEQTGASNILISSDATVMDPVQGKSTVVIVDDVSEIVHSEEENSHVCSEENLSTARNDVIQSPLQTTALQSPSKRRTQSPEKASDVDSCLTSSDTNDYIAETNQEICSVEHTRHLPVIVEETKLNTSGYSSDHNEENDASSPVSAVMSLSTISKPSHEMVENIVAVNQHSEAEDRNESVATEKMDVSVVEDDDPSPSVSNNTLAESPIENHDLSVPEPESEEVLNLPMIENNDLDNSNAVISEDSLKSDEKMVSDTKECLQESVDSDSREASPDGVIVPSKSLDEENVSSSLKPLAENVAKNDQCSVKSNEIPNSTRASLSSKIGIQEKGVKKKITKKFVMSMLQQCQGEFVNSVFQQRQGESKNDTSQKTKTQPLTSEPEKSGRKTASDFFTSSEEEIDASDEEECSGPSNSGKSSVVSKPGFLEIVCNLSKQANRSLEVKPLSSNGKSDVACRKKRSRHSIQSDGETITPRINKRQRFDSPLIKQLPSCIKSENDFEYPREAGNIKNPNRQWTVTDIDVPNQIKPSSMRDTVITTSNCKFNVEVARTKCHKAERKSKSLAKPKVPNEIISPPQQFIAKLEYLHPTNAVILKSIFDSLNINDIDEINLMKCPKRLFYEGLGFGTVVFSSYASYVHALKMSRRGLLNGNKIWMRPDDSFVPFDDESKDWLIRELRKFSNRYFNCQLSSD